MYYSFKTKRLLWTLTSDHQRRLGHLRAEAVVDDAPVDAAVRRGDRLLDEQRVGQNAVAIDAAAAGTSTTDAPWIPKCALPSFGTLGHLRRRVWLKNLWRRLLLLLVVVVVVMVAVPGSAGQRMAVGETAQLHRFALLHDDHRLGVHDARRLAGEGFCKGEKIRVLLCYFLRK